jgi:hypothetical protein
MYPPLILDPPMNKRTGKFVRVKENPMARLTLVPRDWLCYPAKVGPLLIFIYFHKTFAELGFSLCNLFELADDADLNRQPDAVYCFGVPPEVLEDMGEHKTVFFDDENQQMLVAAVPQGAQFGYFGYLKKMVLTLHNIIMMKKGLMPFHGAMVRIILEGGKAANLLLIGDTGAGKSETLEAFRQLGGKQIQDMIVVADDMGSLAVNAENKILAYGTETGAFLRLDDLRPGYALGQMDRAIIMSPNKVNARIILPVTTFEHVMQGYALDMILYANNYDQVDDEHPLIERFPDAPTALVEFREGTVMSKGTTTTTGLVHSYFANVFGPPQYKSEHEKIAKRFFQLFFEQGIYVGQLRTRLGIEGFEQSGPLKAAEALLAEIQKLK